MAIPELLKQCLLSFPYFLFLPRSKNPFLFYFASVFPLKTNSQKKNICSHPPAKGKKSQLNIFSPIPLFSRKPLPTPTVHYLASVSSSPTTMGEPCSWPHVYAASSWQKRGPPHLKKKKEKQLSPSGLQNPFWIYFRK